jgi:hypothetical protein
MRNRLLAGLALLGLLLATPGPIWSGGDKEPDYKKWMERYGTPGPEHKNLEPLHGKFEAEVKIFVPGKKEPLTSKGTAERKWIMGKRYLDEIYHGQIMGQKFEGRGITGYDRLKKKYVFSWIDNQGTGIMYAEGDYDPKEKTITFTYTEDSPFTGKGTKAKDVVKIVSDDEQVFTMYRTPAKGTEFKMMEITYIRLKKDK